MKEFLISLLERFGLAYWVEIKTDYPRCTYYFGPFLAKDEAEVAQAGYEEDLKTEGAQGIKLHIKRCQPEDLTIFEEKEEIKPLNPLKVLRSQAS
ncbi:MAG: DUF1816 domain-containing protein [Microcystis aeruginosa Ma_QC_Ch_20071001_S25]|jgi:hypothetical protein|uniref:DUF1816 domain-containing protein n=2 Tax=Microcystis aeruginosa TaxID=1126 RepID=A0A552FDI8_MICAE|nr:MULTISPECIES: DUF1816 domain-containing protein [unclassified Microcystis]MCA2765242.1 DUF1816 domain-containing protein [Microcystis sp. M151S2]MCA2927171.1 DUF1816 domain-containing protein [Microcystis sp. M020S1]MCA2937085.1 DUF1816 domain-containing protein [Microcystis sp. M015S1]NCR56407.1 DUF1816 domain-containing protein [Microcystis aeruginosa LL13-06]TRU44782.1 MAG: DUF1816 domain-containing protein [Microcystis aeruginosa Ma_QC_Ca_00000000_S207]TRU46277.1 MAG: DUF1816 domain-co